MTGAFRRLFLGFVMLVAIFAAPQANAAGQRVVQHRARLDTRLRAVLDETAPKPQRVIIRVRPGSRLTLRESLRAHGDQILAEHHSLDALTAVVHGEDLGELADKDFVLSVSSDAIVRPHGLLGGLLGLVGGVVDAFGTVLLSSGGDTSGPTVQPAVLRQTLGVDNYTWTGRGVGVAVIDSGLEMTSDFSGRVTAFYDFTKGGITASTPSDGYGHGTHVAGTIAGSGDRSNNKDYRGLAPNVKLVVLKVLDNTGAGYTSNVIRAVDFAVANRAALGIHIINLSLGHPIFEPASSDPLVQAVERAVRAGVIVVAAAGNYGKNPATGLPGYAGVTSPGNAPSAISVGAIKTLATIARSDDRIADYSSAGPTWYDAHAKPDVVAPGHNIVAAAARNGALYKKYPELKAADGDYMLLSGTSMAAAVTSGSIALMLEANRAAHPTNPALTPNAVKAILQYTAVGVHDDLGLEYNALRKGAGSLNTKGAIDLGKSIDTSSLNGQWWLTATPTPWTSIGGETNTWNQGIIWGSGVIWGSTTYYNEMSWGTGIIWGSSTTWSSGIVWGSNVVWTDSSSWSQGIIWGSDYIGQANGAGIIWGSGAGLDAQSTGWKSLNGSSTTANGQ
jgi:serine protease AprX